MTKSSKMSGSFATYKNANKNKENINPILSWHLPLCCASARQRPDYVGRFSVREKDVNFVYQFVKENVSHYIYNDKDGYIVGTPEKFPTYEDCPQAFSMRTYDFFDDISISPWQDDVKLDSNSREYKLERFKNRVHILFHEAVYPIRVSIYEIYNPGNIIRISAYNSDNHKWFVLWNGSPQIVPQASRLFSPPLESCYFKTKHLILEFKRSLWRYYTTIDAVMLIGTSKLIFSKNPKENITDLLKRLKCIHFHHENEDIHNLTTDYKNAHWDIIHLQQNFSEHCIFLDSDIKDIIYKSDLSLKEISRKVNSAFVQPFTEKHSRLLSLKNDLNSVEHMKLSSDESKELPRYSLPVLPDEILLKILKNLDLKTLCCLNQVNKRFYNLTKDFVLYKRLNVRNICHTDIICNIFRYFTPRCKYLQQLDFSGSDFSVLDFVEFLENCGNYLTHLRLSMCFYVDNFILLKISNVCKNLKHLDLRDCKFIDDEGFSYLEKLQGLEHLNVKDTNINIVRLCKILQKNPQIRQLHSHEDVNQDAVAMQLRNSCQNLEVLNMSSYTSACIFTSEGINALADCKNLRKINLWVGCEPNFSQDSLNRLFSSCQRLEEIDLYYPTKSTLKSLTQCQNLKRLYLIMCVTSDIFSIIFEQCPKLQEFHLICCHIKYDLYHNLKIQWKKRYPHIFISIKF